MHIRKRWLTEYSLSDPAREQDLGAEAMTRQPFSKCKFECSCIGHVHENSP